MGPSVLRKLLVIKPSSFGDIVHSLIALQALKDRYPDTRIDFVARDCFAPLPEAALCIDRVIPFRRSCNPCSLWDLARQIRRERYDLVWDMQGLFRSGLMAALARSSRKFGRFDAREGASLLVPRSAPAPACRSHHAVDILLQFLATVGLEPQSGAPLRLRGPGLDAVDARLAGKAPIVMIPHSRCRQKEWPGFEQLTHELLRRGAGHPIVWDSHRPIDAGDLETQPGFINTSGRTSIAQLIGLIQAASVVIANDSGPMHLAAALGVPTVAVFGQTSPARFGAYPLTSSRNLNLRAPFGDWSRLPIEAVADATVRLLRERAFRRTLTA